MGENQLSCPQVKGSRTQPPAGQTEAGLGTIWTPWVDARVANGNRL